MADESGRDRRGGERIPINEELSSAGSTWVSDLSRGGVFVHSDDLLPVGASIELRFTILIDDPVVIEAVGRVVRHSHRPRGMGVQFVTLAPEMFARIEAILDREAPIDSGTPLSLPEPHRHTQDDTTRRIVLARPAPVGGLSVSTVDVDRTKINDDVPTAVFPSLARQPGDDAATAMFRPPPLPGKREVDEDALTGQFPRIKR